MQATDAVKKVVNDHLQGLAANDALFAETLKKPAKNINDCATYIMNEVKKTGKNWFADEEIFAMAVHYYDEDDINIGSAVSGKVVAGHTSSVKKEAVTKPVPVKKEVKQYKSLFDL